MFMNHEDVKLIIEFAIVPVIGWFWHYVNSRLINTDKKIENIIEDLRNFYTKQETDRMIANEIKNIDDKLGHIKELFLYHVSKNENK